MVSRIRELAGRALEWGVRSRLLPFRARSRLNWRRDQHAWIGRRPHTFNGKIRWKMLKDRRPLLTTFADKVAVRDYVTRVAGPEYLTDCYAIVDDPLEIDQSTLPREFVAKVSHGSGGIWVIADHAPPGGKVRVAPDATGPLWPGSGWNQVLTRPDEVDWDTFVRTFRGWLGQNYSRRYYVEWAYINIPPRMLLEEFLREPGSDIPADYKFFVFHGRPRLIQVDTGRFEQHRRNLYLPDWTPLDVEYVFPCAHVAIPPPASLNRMLALAEALGQETDFVRVDLYDVGGRVVFGELTNYPEGGTGRFMPAAFDLELGRWWTLPSSYRRQLTWLTPSISSR
jgi:hypothetical protein